jgi:uncharacterized FlgJ-related protein
MKKIVTTIALALTLVSCKSQDLDTSLTKEDSINVHNIQMAVWALPFKHKDIIVAQAILETGWFKSKNCVKNNNLFGMRRAYTRMTTSDTTLNGYAHYANWRMSIIDYYLLQATRENIIPTNRTQYYHYLDKVYSEVGRNYSDQLKDILSRINLSIDEEDIKPKVHEQKKLHKKVKKTKSTHKKSKP